MTKTIHTLGLLAFIAPTAVSAGDLSTSFEAEVRPFFEVHCFRCHGEKKQKGMFRLDTLKRDFGIEQNAQRWAEIVFRINSGEMPPEDEPQPTADEIAPTVDWISTRLEEGRAARMATRGPVAHYRLSREEYRYTIYDLLGVHYDPKQPGALNEDPRWHGYERIGSQLSLSPSHVQRYFQAAETVLRLAFSKNTVETTRGRIGPEAPSRTVLFPGVHSGIIDAPAPGLYRIHIGLSALPSFAGRVPRVSVWSGQQKRAVAGRDVIASEDDPTVVEIETFLAEGGYNLVNEAPGKLDFGHTFRATVRHITKLDDLNDGLPYGYKLLDDNGKPIFPLLLFDHLEWEGPILTDEDRRKRDGLMAPEEGGIAVVRSSLRRLATRAWRRPVMVQEIDRYVKIVESELASGETWREANLAAMAAVLTSKNFYYLTEGSAAEPRADLDNWEFASRLSYFLWSSMPDEALVKSATQGELRRPGVLRVHLQRMFADPKIERLTSSFPEQWLQLHRVGMFPPDPKLYPDYDKWLEESMRLETIGFFHEVFVRNDSIREFLRSDWSVINSRLAMHYGMPAMREPGFQRVSLRPEDHRGGLLSQASILSLTSDGTRHRPVHRGVWMRESIYGKSPPPPPPNVEPLAPTPANEPKAGIRQQLAAHATHEVCASCHRKIDPFGFAFDNFDAIGRWRTEEIVLGGQGDNPPVDASGALPDGRIFSGPEELKTLLVDDLDRFAEAFVGQLATYALRRVMTIDDATQIKAIAEASEPGGYQLRILIENLVMSELFQRR